MWKLQEVAEQCERICAVGRGVAAATRRVCRLLLQLQLALAVRPVAVAAACATAHRGVQRLKGAHLRVVGHRCE